MTSAGGWGLEQRWGVDGEVERSREFGIEACESRSDDGATSGFENDLPGITVRSEFVKSGGGSGNF